MNLIEKHYWHKHKSCWLSLKTWPAIDEFYQIWENSPIQPTLSKLEGFMLYRLAKKYDKGNFAEVGVYKGFTARLMAEAKHGANELHLFDTWEGNPGPTAEDNVLKAKLQKGELAASMEETKKLFIPYPSVYFHKGLFPETTNLVSQKQFSLVHLDTDLYKSTLEGFKFFYPRIIAGGVFVIHDSNFKGVNQAITDFFDNKKETPLRSYDNQTVIFKVGK